MALLVKESSCCFRGEDYPNMMNTPPKQLDVMMGLKSDTTQCHSECTYDKNIHS